MKNKILVIGGSRFVGPYLIDLLAKDDNEITIFNRGNFLTAYSNAKFVKGDRDNGFSELKGQHFDVVYDTCAYTGVQTKLVIDEVDFDFIVHFGTMGSYAETDIFPIKENHPQGIWPTMGVYGKGKAECEAVLSSSGKKYASLRPVYVLGPNNYCDRENFIYKKLVSGETIKIPGNGIGLNQFVFADEVAKCLYLLGKNKIEGGFNCAGNDYISLVNLVNEMAKISGTVPKIEFDMEHDGSNLDESLFPFSNENFIVDNQLIKKTLNIDFDSLISRLKKDWEEYYKNNLK
ncbi:MAG: NAD-dependent epimerase/dehydratase family protein [Candidatus Shapirobacteria bacterium]